MKLARHKKDLEAIFKAGINRVDPYQLITDSLLVQGDTLTVVTGGNQTTFDLKVYKKIIVIGFGKATAKMALGLEHVLGNRISEGIISVKYGHTEKLKKIEIIEAGHPIPDENGLQAARSIAGMAKKADQDTLVFTLISGGGSALIPFPAEFTTGSDKLAISLAEKQTVTRILLECGATINEVNSVRKHLSGIKGGRLAELLMPATSINLILSDVVGDRLDTIASGTTTSDETTFQDMTDVFEKYDISGKMPENVIRMLEAGLAGLCGDTPKSGNPVFACCHNFLIGTNHLALQAARSKAESLGYQTTILTSALTGEAREVAKVLIAIAKEVQRQMIKSQPARCLLFGGETTVTISGTGKGGRNQEMALSFLNEMQSDPVASSKIWFLSAATDGNDGPTDAAGAFATTGLLAEAKRQGLSIATYLKNNDAYHFFEKIDHLLKTGPTNTNVCDIQIAIIDPEGLEESL